MCWRTAPWNDVDAGRIRCCRPFLALQPLDCVNGSLRNSGAQVGGHSPEEGKDSRRVGVFRTLRLPVIEAKLTNPHTMRKAEILAGRFLSGIISKMAGTRSDPQAATTSPVFPHPPRGRVPEAGFLGWKMIGQDVAAL